MMSIEFLNYCIEKATEHSSEGRVSVYAVAVDKRGNILGEGANKYNKSHPMQYRYAARVNLSEKIFLHAEMSALIRALKTGKEIDTLYIARVLKTGEISAAKPCPICSLIIDEIGQIEVITT